MSRGRFVCHLMGITVDIEDKKFLQSSCLNTIRYGKMNVDFD